MLGVIFRNRGLAVWIGWLLLRRTLARWAAIALRVALALTLIGALALLAWWWLTRDSTGGDDWKRPPEPEPAPPPPAPEPAVPVGV